MGHGPNLIPDATLFIQLGIFLATFVVLRIFLFRPFEELFAMRESQGVGQKNTAFDQAEQVEKLKDAYAAFMDGERRRISALADEERKKIALQERQQVEAARNQASKDLQVVRAETQKEVEAAHTELLPLVEDFSSSIASKVLGYEVKVSPGKTSTKKGAEADQMV